MKLSAQDHPAELLLFAEELGLVVELSAVVKWPTPSELQQLKVPLFLALALP